jgi:rRNA maturation protein Nop10
MSCFDSIFVKCPKCGEQIEFQSKSGDCRMKEMSLARCVHTQDKAIFGVADTVEECPECGTKVKLFVNFTAFAEEFEGDDEEDEEWD